jgi:hypothetical protein
MDRGTASAPIEVGMDTAMTVDGDGDGDTDAISPDDVELELPDESKPPYHLKRFCHALYSREIAVGIAKSRIGLVLKAHPKRGDVDVYSWTPLPKPRIATTHAPLAPYQLLFVNTVYDDDKTRDNSSLLPYMTLYTYTTTGDIYAAPIDPKCNPGPAIRALWNIAATHAHVARAGGDTTKVKYCFTEDRILLTDRDDWVPCNGDLPASACPYADRIRNLMRDSIRAPLRQQWYEARLCASTHVFTRESMYVKSLDLPIKFDPGVALAHICIPMGINPASPWYNTDSTLGMQTAVRQWFTIEGDGILHWQWTPLPKSVWALLQLKMCTRDDMPSYQVTVTDYRPTDFRPAIPTDGATHSSPTWHHPPYREVVYTVYKVQGDVYNVFKRVASAAEYKHTSEVQQANIALTELNSLGGGLDAVVNDTQRVSLSTTTPTSWHSDQLCALFCLRDMHDATYVCSDSTIKTWTALANGDDRTAQLFKTKDEVEIARVIVDTELSTVETIRCPELSCAIEVVRAQGDALIGDMRVGVPALPIYFGLPCELSAFSLVYPGVAPYYEYASRHPVEITDEVKRDCKQRIDNCAGNKHLLRMYAQMVQARDNRHATGYKNMLDAACGILETSSGGLTFADFAARWIVVKGISKPDMIDSHVLSGEIQRCYNPSGVSRDVPRDVVIDSTIIRRLADRKRVCDEVAHHHESGGRYANALNAPHNRQMCVDYVSAFMFALVGNSPTRSVLHRLTSWAFSPVLPLFNAWGVHTEMDVHATLPPLFSGGHETRGDHRSDGSSAAAMDVDIDIGSDRAREQIAAASLAADDRDGSEWSWVRAREVAIGNVPAEPAIASVGTAVEAPPFTSTTRAKWIPASRTTDFVRFMWSSPYGTPQPAAEKWADLSAEQAAIALAPNLCAVLPQDAAKYLWLSARMIHVTGTQMSSLMPFKGTVTLPGGTLSDAITSSYATHKKGGCMRTEYLTKRNRQMCMVALYNIRNAGVGMCASNPSIGERAMVFCGSIIEHNVTDWATGIGGVYDADKWEVDTSTPGIKEYVDGENHEYPWAWRYAAATWLLNNHWGGDDIMSISCTITMATGKPSTVKPWDRLLRESAPDLTSSLEGVCARVQADAPEQVKSRESVTASVHESVGKWSALVRDHFKAAGIVPLARETPGQLAIRLKSLPYNAVGASLDLLLKNKTVAAGGGVGAGRTSQYLPVDIKTVWTSTDAYMSCPKSGSTVKSKFFTYNTKAGHWQWTNVVDSHYTQMQMQMLVTGAGTGHLLYTDMRPLGMRTTIPARSESARSERWGWRKGAPCVVKYVIRRDNKMQAALKKVPGLVQRLHALHLTDGMADLSGFKELADEWSATIGRLGVLDPKLISANQSVEYIDIANSPSDQLRALWVAAALNKWVKGRRHSGDFTPGGVTARQWLQLALNIPPTQQWENVRFCEEYSLEQFAVRPDEWDSIPALPTLPVCLVRYVAALRKYTKNPHKRSPQLQLLWKIFLVHTWFSMDFITIDDTVVARRLATPASDISKAVTFFVGESLATCCERAQAMDGDDCVMVSERQYIPAVDLFPDDIKSFVDAVVQSTHSKSSKVLEDLSAVIRRDPNDKCPTTTKMPLSALAWAEPRLRRCGDTVTVSSFSGAAPAVDRKRKADASSLTSSIPPRRPRVDTWAASPVRVSAPTLSLSVSASASASATDRKRVAGGDPETALPSPTKRARPQPSMIMLMRDSIKPLDGDVTGGLLNGPWSVDFTCGGPDGTTLAYLRRTQTTVSQCVTHVDRSDKYQVAMRNGTHVVVTMSLPIINMSSCEHKYVSSLAAERRVTTYRGWVAKDTEANINSKVAAGPWCLASPIVAGTDILLKRRQHCQMIVVSTPSSSSAVLTVKLTSPDAVGTFAFVSPLSEVSLW